MKHRCDSTSNKNSFYLPIKIKDIMKKKQLGVAIIIRRRNLGYLWKKDVSKWILNYVLDNDLVLQGNILYIVMLK